MQAMSCARLALVSVLFCLTAAPATPVFAQFGDRHDSLPDPVPPPQPRKPPPEDAPLYEAIVPESDLPWEVPEELMASLRSRTEVYDDYARRFTCDETARLADSDASGEVRQESVRRYGYLLINDGIEGQVREYRREFTKNGKLRQAEAEDEEPFPPAYAWVFLFSSVNQPYFSYRLLSTGFDGFDLVHEIQFRGSVPFTNGKNIRQWEGKALIDAFTFTPVEILAEPVGQRDRLSALYRNYNQSFNVMGFRTKPRPMGYRAQIQFRLRKDRLTFPTELRYDTNKAVSATQLIAVRASTRTYEDYLFYGITTDDQVGDVVQP